MHNRDMDAEDGKADLFLVKKMLISFWVFGGGVFLVQKAFFLLKLMRQQSIFLWLFSNFKSNDNIVDSLGK